MPRRARIAAALVATVFVALFFGAPIVGILARGLRWRALTSVVTDRGLRRVAWFTLWQAAVSTVLTLAAAAFPTYVIARYRFPGRRAFRAVVTVPFVLPTVVVGAAFLALLPARLHQTVVAILLAHVFFNVAVVVRTVGSIWSRIDPGLGDAGRTLGGSPWQVARHVTWPLIRPAVAASAAIVFLFTLTSYGVVTVLGGPQHATLEVELYRQSVLLGDLPRASALALLQLLAVGALLVWWSATSARRTAALRLRNDTARRPIGRQWWTVGAVATFTTATLGAPVVALVGRSVRGRRGWGLAGWRAIGSTGWTALATSMRFAVAAAAIAVVVGGLAAFAVAGGGRLGRLLDSGLMLPLGTSAVTLGFGMLITFDRAPLDLRGKAVLVPLAHALVGIPFVVRTMLPVLRAIDSRQRDAAATLGASPGRAWAEIDLRLAARPALAAAGFAAAVSLGEFGATSFLTRRGSTTVPIEITRALSRPGELSAARAAALATVLMIATAALVLGLDRTAAGSNGDRDGDGGW